MENSTETSSSVSKLEEAYRIQLNALKPFVIIFIIFVATLVFYPIFHKIARRKHQLQENRSSQTSMNNRESIIYHPNPQMNPTKKLCNYSQNNHLSAVSGRVSFCSAAEIINEHPNSPYNAKHRNSRDSRDVNRNVQWKSRI